MEMQTAVHDALDLKWQLTEHVDLRKGKKRFSQARLTRRQLERHGAISGRTTTNIKLTVFPEAYAPSKASLLTLANKIHLNDLLLETHHHGSFLILRTFAHSTNVSEIQTFMPVEDETGEVDRIAILNFGLSSWPQKQLPPGAVLAIKEPFYSSVPEDMGMALCVHHPSDVLFLDEDHPMFPHEWKSSTQPKTASEWKLDGNNALKSKDYIKANRCYTKGLAALTTADNDLKSDLLRNRAQVRLSLGCYETAKVDAIASTEAGARRDESKHGKALYRAGRAAYELHDYKSAQDMFQQMLATLPSDQDGLRELKRTELRIHEAENGVFDFPAMLKKISETADYRSEQASYLRRTSIRNAVGSSKGLFATENIFAGQIILCEKVFVASNTPKNSPALSVIINPTNNMGMHGSYAALWINTVRKSFHNPSHNINSLYDGTPRSAASAADSSLLVVDDMPVIDVFRLQNILEHNSFGFEADKDRVRVDVVKAVRNDSSGVWTQASHMNHSCLFNSSRGFIGDFIVVRANKDISPGEEITTMYCPIDGNFGQLQHNLKHWGFSCDCKLCKVEKKCEETHESRTSLMFEVNSFLKSHPLQQITALMAKDAVPANLVEEAKRFEKFLKKSYPSKLFATYVPKTKQIIELLPTMGMAGIHEWLMFAHWRQPPSALDYAAFVLMDHGYKVTINKSEGIYLDRTNCVLSMKAVMAMQYIEHFYTMAGDKTLAKYARALAEEMYVTYNGSMVDYKGFVD
ncbi:SET domain-containing protein, partial [Aureobasidium melanogenum]